MSVKHYLIMGFFPADSRVHWEQKAVQYYKREKAKNLIPPHPGPLPGGEREFTAVR